MYNNMKFKYVHNFSMLLKKLFFIALYVNLLSTNVLLAQSNINNDLKIMTFNIRYGKADDGENSWDFRKDNVAKTIEAFKPNLLGLQEALKMQIDELLFKMPEYDYVGVGRDDGKSEGEYSCILYQKDRFTVDSSETFWFSETPNIIASKGWGNNITRICTWVRLQDKILDKDFYYFNVHLDHESQPSREKSAELLMNKINEKTLPVILTGDFNCGDENGAIKIILSNGLIDTYRSVNEKQVNEGTFNSFKGEINGDKIDFIFASKIFTVVESEIVRTNYHGKFPSDHFPVTAVIGFK